MRIIFKVVLVSMSTVKTAEFSRVASTSEIPPGIMRKVTVDGKDVVLANVDGKYYAMGTPPHSSRESPHRGVLLDEYRHLQWRSIFRQHLQVPRPCRLQ